MIKFVQGNCLRTCSPQIKIYSENISIRVADPYKIRADASQEERNL